MYFLFSQFSLVHQILKNPDVFCFADYPFHSVAVDILKAPPESDNKEITTWRSLDLVETLLYLSDRGIYTQVQEMFKLPIQHCPDVLVLALLQINPPVTVLRQELLTNLIPIFLGTHPNSAIILHHAWHSQVQYTKCYLHFSFKTVNVGRLKKKFILCVMDESIK
jgi:CCR4-NOT transcription complex subunit 1